MTPPLRTLSNWSPEAVVFDCDGTLMDTERHWQDARNRAFREFGLLPPPGFAERAKGVHYVDCGRLMAEETNKPELAADLTTALLAHFMSLVAEDPSRCRVQVRWCASCPGGCRWPWPATARSKWWRRASAAPGCAATSTTSSCPGCRRGSRRGDSGKDAERPQAVRPKPWPDVYTTAARLCGARPETALAVEDSVTGIESAWRAGLRILGVGPLPDDGNTGHADAWVPALDRPEVLGWVRNWRPASSPGAERDHDRHRPL